MPKYESSVFDNSTDGMKEQLREQQIQSRDLFNRICKERQCHDCGAKEGELHVPGCDMETCPFCFGQLISCGCIYEMFYEGFSRDKPLSGLPKEVYENGVPEDVREKWEAELEKKGRIPYVIRPFICVRCGIHYPDLFMVPDDEWEAIVGPIFGTNVVLCRECYDHVKVLMEGGDT